VPKALVGIANPIWCLVSATEISAINLLLSF
jgi:hypothetical protein